VGKYRLGVDLSRQKCTIPIEDGCENIEVMGEYNLIYREGQAGGFEIRKKGALRVKLLALSVRETNVPLKFHT
jgi:hypothetical protein